MYALNLDPHFAPFPDLPTLDYKRIDFPSGFEPHIRVNPDQDADTLNDDELVITTRIHSGNDLLALLMAKAAVDAWLEFPDIKLFLPFMPYARMDRQVVGGDAAGLKVIADLINRMDFDQVHVFDPHSSQTYLELKDCVCHQANDFIRWVFNAERDRVKKAHDVPELAWVIPDKGATKRFKLFEADNIVPWRIIQCDKRRDGASGQLTVDIAVEENLVGLTCVIVDDICDGGGTFLPIAEKLKALGADRVVLAVSHGIFSKGIVDLVGHGIEHFYTTNSFQDLNDDGSGDAYFSQFRDWSHIQLS